MSSQLYSQRVPTLAIEWAASDVVSCVIGAVTEEVGLQVAAPCADFERYFRIGDHVWVSVLNHDRGENKLHLCMLEVDQDTGCWLGGTPQPEPRSRMSPPVRSARDRSPAARMRPAPALSPILGSRDCTRSGTLTCICICIKRNIGVEGDLFCRCAATLLALHASHQFNTAGAQNERAGHSLSLRRCCTSAWEQAIGRHGARGSRRRTGFRAARTA